MNTHTMPARPLALPEPDSPDAPFLFSHDDIKEITDEEKRESKYTAARCPADLKRSIVTLLKESRSEEEVAQLLRTHHETVRNVHLDPVCAREIDNGFDQIVLPLARRGLVGQLRRLAEHPNCVPFASSGLLAKNLYDITALEEGKPTERLEQNTQVDIFGAFIAMTEKIMDGKNMGLAGGKSALIQPDGTKPGEILDLIPDPAVPVPADLESEVSKPVTDSESGHVTASVTDCSPDRAPGSETAESGQTPRGGDGQAERTANDSTDNGAWNFWPNTTLSEEKP